MKKLVVKFDLHDDKAKQKALKTVSTLQGIDSIAVDMKEKKLTVIGTVDPVNVVSKLRKYWRTDIITVGPAKDPEKKEEAKPEGEQAQKEGGGGEAAGKEQQDPNKKPEGGEGQKPGSDSDQEKKNGEQPSNEGGGDDQGKKGEAGSDQPNKKLLVDPAVFELARAHRAYNPQLTSYYYVQSMEENPNACSIC